MNHEGVLSGNLEGYIQKFLDWTPGAKMQMVQLCH